MSNEEKHLKLDITLLKELLDGYFKTNDDYNNRNPIIVNATYCGTYIDFTILVNKING